MSPFPLFFLVLISFCTPLHILGSSLIAFPLFLEPARHAPDKDTLVHAGRLLCLDALLPRVPVAKSLMFFLSYFLGVCFFDFIFFRGNLLKEAYPDHAI